MKLFVKSFNELSTHELYNMIKVREEVFVVEQNCVYLDCDGYDQSGDHIFVKEGSTVVATLRILPPGIKSQNVSIGRVVVAKEARRKGLATKMLIEALVYIYNKYGDVDVELSAQNSIKEVYGGVGFDVVSDVYLEDGIDHVRMIRKKGNPMYSESEELNAKEAELDSKIYNEAVRDVRIESLLEKGIENDEFCLQFQPVMDIQTGLVSGHEALLRWDSEELGRVFPNEFIPIAEKTMIIHKLGLFVLREACTFGRLIHQQFGKMHGMAVNVSLVQFMADDFVEQVIGVLETTGYDPKYLILELTESFEYNGNTRIIEMIKALIDYGINISLDDFGTGYSALENVFLLPIQFLKIDKSLLWNSMDNNNGKALIKTVVEFSNKVGINVIVEGVETKLMEDEVKSFNSRYGQGYLYMKPSDKVAILEYLRKEQDDI